MCSDWLSMVLNSRLRDTRVCVSMLLSCGYVLALQLGLWLCAGITLVFVAMSFRVSRTPGPLVSIELVHEWAARISRIGFLHGPDASLGWERRLSSRKGHVWPVGMNV